MGVPRDEFGAGKYSDIQVQVTLTRPFVVGKTEVTRAQWSAVGWEQPVWVHPGDGPSKCLDAQCPVDNVTFFDAISFANRFSESQGLPPCYTLSGCTGAIGDGFQCTSVLVNASTVYECEGYRLLTEAEWEYAARAGTKTAFYSGDIIARDLSDPDPFGCYLEPNLEPIAWYCHNAGDRAHPVAQKEPNGWGLFDMLGNVGEFCNDMKDGRGYGQGPLVDPIGAYVDGREIMPQREVPNLRIERGGSAFAVPLNCKAGYRLSFTSAASSTGFRLAKTQ